MQVARQHEIPVVVLEIPRDFQVWPNWKKPSALPPAADLRSTLPQQKFARICNELRMTCLDLLPRFAEAAAQRREDPLYYAVDPHWTPAGHRLAAQVLFEFLDSHDMVREVRH